MGSVRTGFFFEYIFYRLTKFFIRIRLVGSGIGYISILYIALVQFVAFLDLFEIIGLVFTDGVPVVRYITNDSTVFSIPCLILFYYLNNRMLNGKYYTLREYWSNEAKQVYWRKGFLVAISLLTPVVLFVFLMESRG